MTSTRARARDARSPPGTTRTPRAPATRDVATTGRRAGTPPRRQHHGAPREGARERHRDRDLALRHHAGDRGPPTVAGDAPESLDRGGTRRARAPRAAGCSTTIARIAVPGPSTENSSHRRQRRASRSADRPRSGSRSSRRGSTAAVASADAAAEERPPRQPEREDVGMLVREPALEDEASQREQHEADDQRPGRPRGRDAAPRHRHSLSSGASPVRRRASGRVLRSFPARSTFQLMISLQRVSKTYPKTASPPSTTSPSRSRRASSSSWSGPSGSGKSTTMRLLTREDEPTDRRGLRCRQEPREALGVVGRAEAPAQHRHGLPGLQAAAGQDGLRERRVRARGDRQAEARDRPARAGDPRVRGARRRSSTTSPTSSRVASSSGCRSRARA